jgi:hypothetical protein
VDVAGVHRSACGRHRRASGLCAPRAAGQASAAKPCTRQHYF